MFRWVRDADGRSLRLITEACWLWSKRTPLSSRPSTAMSSLRIRPPVMVEDGATLSTYFRRQSIGLYVEDMKLVTSYIMKQQPINYLPTKHP
ncbi:hypothetical protein B0T16DRAFT_21449 [Cercophora newfieldiana]|uniref:Uncharacterized protein n=1 Tax=Cercophora newfieldiana TaxID=92897 RepID=A0AA40D0C4_9PEZI|nr:hypothetical protein B0T16DRAFT_21449 [Cercophora newfieldiana]